MTSDVYSYVTAKNNPNAKPADVERLEAKRSTSIDKFQAALNKMESDLKVKDGDADTAISNGKELVEQVNSDDLSTKDIANLNMGGYKKFQTLCSQKVRKLLQVYKDLKKAAQQ